MAQQDLPSVHDLIPFELALLLVFRRVYVEPVVPRADLSGLANVVSSLVPVYIYAGGVVRLLRTEELKGGLFAEGGRRLYFLDGRPELRDLAVTNEVFPAAIAALVAVKTTGAR